RKYAPPVTTRLVQQLSLPAPQLVSPTPPPAQLGGDEPEPLSQPEPEAPDPPLEPPLSPPMSFRTSGAVRLHPTAHAHKPPPDASAATIWLALLPLASAAVGTPVDGVGGRVRGVVTRASLSASLRTSPGSAPTKRTLSRRV